MTMTTEVSRTNGHQPTNTLTPADFSERAAQAIDDVIAKGDLTKMTPTERVNYYRRVCESLGLNPLTKPFEYIQLSGQLRFYATKGCTDQLRELKNVTVEVTSKGLNPELSTYEVWVRASRPGGRTDEDMGVVSVRGLSGEGMANAIMKAITKAKRRATLSICGLGWLDETEIDSIPGAQTVPVDYDTGEILPDTRITRDGTPQAERTPAEQRPLAPNQHSPNTGGTPDCVSCGKALTKAQMELSGRNYGESLCPACQREKKSAAPPAAPAAAVSAETLVQERRAKAAPLIALMEGLPKVRLDAYRADWEDRYGTANPRNLEFSAIDAEIQRITADNDEIEGDPFDDRNGFQDGPRARMEDSVDGQPPLLAVAGKGHESS